MIDGVYGQLVKGSETAARERLDLFTAATPHQQEETR